MEAELAGLRRRLRDPEPLCGAILSMPEPGLATLLGTAGFDYVVVDAEHGPFTLASLRAVLEALDATAAHAIVRVAASASATARSVASVNGPCSASTTT